MRWTIVGYYPRLRAPYVCYIEAEKAQEAVESCLTHARKHWPKKRQIIITHVVGPGGTAYEFSGLLSSVRGETVGTARVPKGVFSRELDKGRES